jgi:hypothetical protein
MKIQKYQFTEGVYEAWMEFSDQKERAYTAEEEPVYLASEADARIEALEKAIRDALETLKDYNEDGLDIAIRSLVQDLDEALNGITRFRPSS